MRYLEDSRIQGRQFDYIFGDLTDIPIDTDSNCKFDEGDNLIKVFHR